MMFRFSLSRKFLLAVLVLFLPILILFIYTYREIVGHNEEDVVDDITTVAGQYYAKTYLFIEAAKIRVSDFASDGLVKEYLTGTAMGRRVDAGALTGHLLRNKSPLDKTIHNVYVITAAGRVAASTDSSAAGLDLSGSEFFLKGSRGLAVTESLVGSPPEPSLVISAPVLDPGTGRTAGVVANAILISSLNTLFAERPGDGHGSGVFAKKRLQAMDAYIVNKDRFLITDSMYLKGAAYKSKVGTMPVEKCLSSNRSLSGFYADYRGVEVAGASACIPQLGWTLMVEMDKDLALRPAKVMIRRAVITAVVVAALAGAFFLAFFKIVVGPIIRLASAAERIARGEYDIDPRVSSSDEIGVLAESFRSMARDIRQRIGVIENSEARLRTAQRVARMGSWEIDLSSNRLTLSDELYGIFGVPAGEAGAGFDAFGRFIHPADREAVLRNMTESVEQGRPFTADYRVIRPDGAERIVHSQGLIIYDEAARPVCMTGTTQDVTERMKAEESRSLLSAIVENTSDFVSTADTEGRVLYYNRAARNMLGIGEDEDISGIAIRDVHPEWAGEVVLKEGLPAAMRDGIWSGETSFLHRGGREIPASQVILAHKGPDGKVQFFSTIVRDITERKMMEKRLKLLLTITQEISEARDLNRAMSVVLARICEATGWCFAEAWVQGGDGADLVCSQAYRLSGCASVQGFGEGHTFRPGVGLPGRVWSSQDTEWIRDLCASGDVFVRAGMARGAGLGVPIVAGSKTFAVLTFFTPDVSDEDKRYVELVSGVAAQLGLVLQRKRAEEELRKSEMKFRTLVEHLPDTTWMYIASTDDVASTVYVGPQIRALGYSQEEWIKGHDMWARALHPDDRERVLAAYRRAHEAQEPFSSEYRLVARDGRVLWCRDEAILVKDESGSPVFFQGVVQDITGRKAAEEAILAKTKELDALNSDLHDLTIRLSMLEELERKKFAELLHEGIGQNLVALKLAYKRCLKGCSRDDGSDSDDLPDNIMYLMDETINATRAMTASLYPAPLRDMGLRKAVKWQLDAVSQSAGVEYTASIDEAVETLTDQEKQVIFSVIRECVQNTAKHGRATKVEVSCARTGGSMVIAVRDNGLGFMPEEVKAKEGRGFGLLLMREWARSVKGDFSLRSEPGSGTSVTVSFPV